MTFVRRISARILEQQRQREAASQAAIDDVLLQADFASDARAANDGAAPSLDVAAPWRPGLPLCFSLGRSGDARMDVYDAQGRVVRKLLAGRMSAGEHRVAWDGRNGRGQAVGRGMYFVRLATADGAVTRKILLARRD